MIDNTNKEIYVQVWQEDVDNIYQELKGLENKGIKSLVILYGQKHEYDIGLKNYYKHGFEEQKIAEVGGRWITIVSDSKELVFGYIQNKHNAEAELKSYGARIQAVRSSDEAVEDADIITTATTSRRPVFDGKKVKDGAHINTTGVYTPQMQEIDEFIVKRADKIYLDSKDAVLSEAGDLIIPIEKGIITKEKITGELGEVILNMVKGRESDNEITIFDSVGISVLDVVTANMIYKKALRLSVRKEIDF